ncbi:MAG: TIGR04283 family arsenosugar biosynthesis glycosyltransferase [Nitrospirae bacterium]|nr:TIGR04283 family arsenosugar biosynthesis glycosyltransferase [Nitrospirota bacterium]
MISVIIPTLNEEKALPDTLRHLLGQAGDFEVIVVDGGSVDHTVEIVRGEPRVRLLTASKGRASQMNTGARHATGDWLLFLHADTLLPEGALARLNSLETDATVQAGGFLHRFSGTDWQLRMLSYFNNVRCRWSKIIYGDQAMFVRRTLFERLSGFPNKSRLEDVLFSRKLVRIVTPVLLAPPVVTDSRKFVQMGIWRSVFRASFILLSIELGLPLVSPAFFRDIR